MSELQLDIKDIHRPVIGTIDGNQAISDFSPYPRLIQEGDNTESVSTREQSIAMLLYVMFYVHGGLA